MTDDEQASEQAEPAAHRRLHTRVADAFGRGAGYLVVGVLGVCGRLGHEFLKVGTTVLTTVIPFVGRVHRSLAEWALYRYHKKAGGDAIGFIHEPNGTISIVPVKHKPQSVDDDEVERAGWHAQDRDRSWHEGADGREVDRLGKTPVVWLDSASTQRATPVEARFAEALDLDRVEGLYRLQDEGQLELNVQLGGGSGPGAGNGAAMADGGATWDATVESIRGAIWEESVVDIGADDHDGMRVNPRKVKETYREKTGSEQMDEAERLGFEAGIQADGDRTGFVIKILLIALGFVAAALIGPDLLSQASGAVGGGGGGTIPFMLGGLL